MQHFHNVERLYTYDPNDPMLWEKRASWLDVKRSFYADRQELISHLHRYNQKVGMSTETVANLERLKSPESLVIVGGQQAGLFTGPLLVIYKAITIIQAAREAERKLGRPVIPLFWIAGEDHDWEEVNHTYMLTPQHDIERIRLEAQGAGRRSVSRTSVADWQPVIAQLDDSLIPTEFKGPLVERLRAFADQSNTLVDLFARLMAWLFGHYGLVLLDSDDSGLRAIEAPMFRKLLDHHERLHAAFLAARDSVTTLGFEASTEVPERAVNLFIFDEQGERILLHPRDANTFQDRKGHRQFQLNELLEWSEHAPERFSNNVLTRPLMQDYLLPTLGVVLGPGELAYWALTNSAFEEMGMQMPPLIPRQEYTLIEAAVDKHMVKFGLTLSDVIDDFEDKRNNWLRQQDTLQLDDRFRSVRGSFVQDYESLISILSDMNPAIGKLGHTNLQKIVEQIDFLHKKATDAHNMQFEGALRHWERIQRSLMPNGKLQERVYNIFYYLNKYGDSWLHELVETNFETSAPHRVVYL